MEEWRRSDSRWMNGVGQRRGKEWTNSGNKNDEKKQMVEIKEERKRGEEGVQE